MDRSRRSLILLSLLCLPMAAGSAGAASLLLTAPGQFANEGDALPPTIYDFDGDGHPDISSEETGEGSPLTTIRVLTLAGTELWTETLDVRDLCPACDYGSFSLFGFAEIEETGGKEAILSWFGVDQDVMISEERGVLVYSPLSGQASEQFDSAAVEWIGDFDGDGWDEIVIEYYDDDTIDLLEVWGHASGSAVGNGVPSVGRLKVEANRPNPFNPETTIRFDLPEPRAVSVEILSVSGRLVRAVDLGVLPAGSHELKWDGLADSGRRVPSGSYFARLHAGEYVAVRKMVLIK